MKIKSIRKTGPELYLVEYHKFFGAGQKRYIIHEHSDGIEMLYYRDSNELAQFESAAIEWMIRNNIEFFDNYPPRWEPGGQYFPDLILGPESENKTRKSGDQ